MTVSMEDAQMSKVRELFSSVDKSYVSTLPRFVYEGKIVVVHSLLETEHALHALYKTTNIVGIDTETRPAFRKGVHHKVALLQVSSLDICFLFRLSMIGMPPSLVAFLEDSNMLKVGLSLKDDLAQLRQRHDFSPAGFLDLQPYAKEMGISDMSLQKLYANVFRYRISKSAQCSNWEAEELSETQKRYAATDAYTCLQLYQELSALRVGKQFVIKEFSHLSV